MSKATKSHSPQNLSVQQAAGEILALVNASPRTPWPSEVEAIVSRVDKSAVDPSDAMLLVKVRAAIVREAEVTARYVMEDGPELAAEDAEPWDALHKIQRSIPYPPRTATQMLCHVEIAYHGADKKTDGTLDVAEDDCADGTATRLVEACMAYFGGGVRS